MTYVNSTLCMYFKYRRESKNVHRKHCNLCSRSAFTTVHSHPMQDPLSNREWGGGGGGGGRRVFIPRLLAHETNYANDGWRSYYCYIVACTTWTVNFSFCKSAQYLTNDTSKWVNSKPLLQLRVSCKQQSSVCNKGFELIYFYVW